MAIVNEDGDVIPGDTVKQVVFKRPEPGATSKFINPQVMTLLLNHFKKEG